MLIIENVEFVRNFLQWLLGLYAINTVCHIIFLPQATCVYFVTADIHTWLELAAQISGNHSFFHQR